MKQAEVETYVRDNNLLTTTNNKSGIYAITIDNRVAYIGQSNNTRTRCMNHIYLIENGYYAKEKKYSLLLSARLGGHKVDCVNICFCAVEDLDTVEEHYIRQYKPPLNILTPFGKNDIKDLMIEDLISILYTYCAEL